MDILRELFDEYYQLIQSSVFKKTACHPQKAHDNFLLFCKFIHRTRLSSHLLNHSNNCSSLEISNAAGFNKNGEFPLEVMKDLGFTRAVVGTVTYDPWIGNPQPNIRRYPLTESMVNWMGLPGIGAKKIAEKLIAQQHCLRCSSVPITINLMSTPQKQGEEVLHDLKGTILATRHILGIDRFELNISCPNTHAVSGKVDARKENLKQLGEMLSVVEELVLEEQKIFLKVSPDSTEKDVMDITTIAHQHKIAGFVTTNTTTNHRREFIPLSPQNNRQQVGGASGNAVYQDSLRVQQLFVQQKKMNKEWTIIASGGINSLEKLKERFSEGASELQIFTPFIFSGPQLLRRFHRYFKSRDQ